MNKLVFLPGSIEPRRHPKADELERLWREGRTMAEVADATGLSPRGIDFLREHGRVDMPKRQRGVNGGAGKAQRDPTPSELRKRCLAVRERWTAERRDEALVGGRTLSETEMLTEYPKREGRAGRPVRLGTKTGRQ